MEKYVKKILASRVYDVAVESPLMRARNLSSRLGNQVMLKREDMQPVFSFNKFPNVNKNLGPEMKSTGESILFIKDLKDDDFYELYSRRKMYLSK